MFFAISVTRSAHQQDRPDRASVVGNRSQPGDKLLRSLAVRQLSHAALASKPLRSLLVDKFVHRNPLRSLAVDKFVHPFPSLWA
jgi:hypothetical protein